MTKTKTDYNSIENQEIKSQFVKREVLTCFSYEMDEILKASNYLPSHIMPKITLPSWDDIENAYEDICPKCGSDDVYKVLEADKPSANDDCFECGSCGILQENEQLESQPREIFEWWIVTEYLYNKLKAQGQPVLEWGNNCYWGRCTSGQAILLDHVISVICEEMEILDGQKYSWSNKKGNK